MEYRLQKQFTIITIKSTKIDLFMLKIFDLDSVKSFDSEIGIFDSEDVSTNINTNFVLYLGDKLFNRIFYINSMLSLHLLLVKMAEVFGRNTIIISSKSEVFNVIFKSKQFIKCLSSGIDYKMIITYEYEKLVKSVEFMPFSIKFKDPARDLFLINPYYCSPEHKTALECILPKHKIELLEYSIRAHLIIIIHCLSVKEWCVYNYNGDYYTTNSDLSNLQSFDISIFDDLRHAFCLP